MTVLVRVTGVVIAGAIFWACGESQRSDDEDGPSRGGTAGSLGGSSPRGGNGAMGGASGTHGGAPFGGQGGTSDGGTGDSGGSETGGNGGTSGVSGAAGSGATGPCQGLACDQTTCTVGNCTQMPCASGASTTLSGTVYDPAGKTPLYNALVYVPNGPVPRFTDGASCARCDGIELNAVTSTLTGADGRFVVPNVPVGSDIPLVIQVGKWRRQLSVPGVLRCVDTPLTDVESTSLPSKRSEGDIPLIAITTGGADSMECLPRRMGLEDSEFSTETGSGRVHLYAGTDAGMSIATKSFSSGMALTHSDELWSSIEALRRYDIVILSCEGDANENPRPAGAREALYDYMTIGGRVLASHWHHRWISTGPAPLPEVGTWNDRQNPENPAIATINTSFPKGGALADWLVNVGASSMRGQMEVLEARDNIQAVNAAYATEWMRVVNINIDDTPAIQYLSFNTPLDVEESMQCGRVVYTDLHVSNASDPGTPLDAPGLPFPEHCAVHDLSAQEKAVAFMLFDLSACIQDDALPPRDRRFASRTFDS